MTFALLRVGQPRALARVGVWGGFAPPQKRTASERVNPQGYALSTHEPRGLRATREVRST